MEGEDEHEKEEEPEQEKRRRRSRGSCFMREWRLFSLSGITWRLKLPIAGHYTRIEGDEAGTGGKVTDRRVYIWGTEREQMGKIYLDRSFCNMCALCNLYI